MLLPLCNIFTATTKTLACMYLILLVLFNAFTTNCCEFQSLASQLKAQLEAARSVKSVQDAKNSMSTSEESEVVVLSRTDRQGMARPLPSRKHAVEPKGRRRKKDKV